MAVLDTLTEYKPEVAALPIHLSRFGTMLFQTAGFLYSLFDDRKDSTNLLRIWKGFDHPFNNELQNFYKKLSPFKNDLKSVRNSIAFHGSLTRSREKAGLSIFDIESPRGSEFAGLISDMLNLALKMIMWHVERMNEADQPMKIWQEFDVELNGYRVIRL